MAVACGVAVAGLLGLLALLRPLDHDESQYVASAVLTAAGLLPYRDFAYLQTPLQPFVFAPIAAIAGVWTWPALRVANALISAAVIGCVHRAGRLAGAPALDAAVAAGLLACCDVFLFAAGVARNDALPALCLSLALVGIVHPEADRPARGVAIGFALALAAAAKISYALPAAAFGVVTLCRSRRDAAWLMLGALLPVAFIVWIGSLSPAGALFGMLEFPSRAPFQFYAGQPWKLSLAAKMADTAKYLALGPALPAIALVGADALRRRTVGALDVMICAALLAAMLPTPTWRQYLLPVLPPLFVRLSIAFRHRRPDPRWRSALAAFALAGLVPTAAAMPAWRRPPLLDAIGQASAVRRVMDAHGLRGPVITLAPQYLPATGRLPDVRFAAGPFYYRSRDLMTPIDERRLHVVSARRPVASLADARLALVGGPLAPGSSDAALDAGLRTQFGGRPIAVPRTRFVLLVR